MARPVFILLAMVTEFIWKYLLFLLLGLEKRVSNIFISINLALNCIFNAIETKVQSVSSRWELEADTRSFVYSWPFLGPKTKLGTVYEISKEK